MLPSYSSPHKGAKTRFVSADMINIPTLPALFGSGRQNCNTSRSTIYPCLRNS